jgi:hypothetical protein
MPSAQILQFPHRSNRKNRTPVKPRFAQDVLALAAVADWSPKNDRYRLSEVMQVHELSSPKATAAALEILGWKKIWIRRTEGRKRSVTTWWSPPGAKPIRKRGRGRPTYWDYLTDF